MGFSWAVPASTFIGGPHQCGRRELTVIWLSGCTMVHPVQCFPFMFCLQHFSHKIEEWQKGVLIVMWTCWCTKHTLRGAFPGLSLPQPWLEDLTNAGGGELIVIWLSGCTMVHPVQCFCLSCSGFSISLTKLKGGRRVF